MDDKTWFVVLGMVASLPLLAVFTGHIMGHLVGVLWGILGWLLFVLLFDDYNQLKEQLEKKKDKG